MKLTKNNLKWWIIIAISPCLAIIYINQTAVVVALPKLQIELGMNAVMQQWVINSYSLTLAVLILVGGRLSDIFGNRRSFLWGLSGLLIASVLCGVAPNGALLIIFRAIQGFFAALLIPNTSVVVMGAFPPEERGKAMGIYIGFSSVFLALGPLIGGIFTEFLSWRLVFFINLPFGLFSLFIALRTISKKKPPPTNNEINWVSVFFSVFATCSLIAALMEAVNFGWSSPLIIGLFIFAIVCYISFLGCEANSRNPLINHEILREKAFLIALIIIFCVQACIMSRLFWVLFFQIGLGKSPFIAGLMTMPSTAMSMFFAPLAGRLLDRYGPRLPVISGFFMLTLGIIWISISATSLNLWILILGTIFFGIGSSLSIACIFTPAISIIPAKYRGAATGLYNQIREIGGAFGLAAIGATITNIDDRYFKKLLKLENLPTTINSQVDSILSGTKNSQLELAALPHAIAIKIHEIATIAYTHAFRYGMIVASIFALVVLILAIKKLPNINLDKLYQISELDKHNARK